MSDPTEPAEEPELPEVSGPVDMRPTGVVRLDLGDFGGDGDGVIVRLRRPFFGELRKLRELHDQALDNVREAVEPLQGQLEEIRRVAVDTAADHEQAGGDPKDPGVRAEQVARLREVNEVARELQQRVETVGGEQRAGWWVQAIDMLAMNPQDLAPLHRGDVLDPDRLPGWVADAQLIPAVLGHWRSVPLGRGRRPRGG